MTLHSYHNSNVLFRPTQITFLTVTLLILTCCQRNSSSVPQIEKSLFDSVPNVSLVRSNIGEASGIADSKNNPGYLWVEEDSGNPTELILLKHDGDVQKTISLNGVANRDWEDMVVSGANIYIGDIGDNNSVYPDYAFYKFPEPQATDDIV